MIQNFDPFESEYAEIIRPDSLADEVLRGFVVAIELTPITAKVSMQSLLISQHELRHTFVSPMENEVEAPRRVTTSLVGHANQGTTDRYSHVTIERKSLWNGAGIG